MNDMSKKYAKFENILIPVLISMCLMISVSCMRNEVPDIAEEHKSLTSDHADKGYEHVISDASLSLYINKATGQFYVVNSSNDAIYYSNPPDSDNDVKANNYYKMNMKSQIEIRYLNPKLVQESLNNFVGSVMNGSYTVNETDRGVRFDYDFVDEGFVIPVEYYLENDKFYAKVIVDEIVEYKQNLLLEIVVLPYFAAPDGLEEGYILIPDGCGAIIGLSDVSSAAGSYSGSVYGRDSALNLLRSSVNLPNQITLPLFGIVEGDTGILAVIEEGDAQSRIYASPNGVNTGYASVGASVIVRNSDTALLKEMTGVEKSVTVFNPAIAKDLSFRIEYSFLSGENANYSAMARIYQEKLFGNNSITVDHKHLIADLLLSTRIRKNFLIFPYSGVESLLSTEDIRAISDELDDIGFDEHIIKLSGWQKKSMFSAMQSEFKPSAKTGSRSDYFSLAGDMTANNNILAPGFDLLNIYEFSSGIRKNDAVRNVSGGILELFRFRSSTYRKNTEIKPINVLNSTDFVRLYSEFVISSAQGFVMIADDTGAHLLASNNHRNKTAVLAQTRQKVMESYLTAFESSLSKGMSLMFDDPQGYALKYAHSVTDLANSTSGYIGFSEEVPFVQMVLSGKVNYAGEPLNLVMNMHTSLLKMVEFGEIPYFKLSELKEDLRTLPPVFNENYSINYSYYKSKISDIYDFAEQYRLATENAKIIRHEKIRKNIYVTEYSNGTEIYVNYGSAEYSAGELTLPPQSYGIGGES